MKKLLLSLLILTFSGLTIGCSTQNQAGQNMDYEQTKKMVVDILKTDDGKKALKEVLADEALKQELVLDNTVVSDSITTTLVSDQGKQFWQKAFEDPKFAETFAKSMKDQNETLQKNLLKDPDYRKALIEILHDPDLEKEYADLLKSNEYREHIKTVITETIESPIFQAKIQEILLKAAEEQGKKQDSKEGESA